MSEKPPTVTVREIATIMGRSTRAVRYYIERGQLDLTPLPNTDPIQFAEADVLRALAEFVPPRRAMQSTK